MKNIDFKKEYDFVIFETHNEKPSPSNLFRRRLLLIMQVLLGKIYYIKVGREKNILEEIYYTTKNRYLIS